MSNIFPVNSDRHADALNERDCFLRAHPELKALQKEIDERLKKAATGHNRLVIIHDLMMDAFLEMHRKLQSITGRRT